MFKILWKHPEFMIPILILLSLSIICQISMGVLCHKLIWESENMSSTTNKSLQQLKLKFSSCCKLHEGVSNISVFVDKYINKIKIHGFSLSTLKHLSGQFILLSVLLSGIGACRGIVLGESVIYIVPYYIISFLGLYCYFAVSSLVDIADKANILRTNLIDYLENHFTSRLEQTTLDLKLVQGEETKTGESAGINKAEGTSRINGADSESAENRPDEPEAGVLSHTEAKELESLLKEFLA